MNTYIPSQQELESTITKAVEQAVLRKLPEIIQKATRKPVYSIDETCDLLGVSRRHLQYLRDSNQISYVQNGRKVYFQAIDLEAYFEKYYINKEGK